MKLIKSIHFYLAYVNLRFKKIEPHFARVMAEQYIYFKYSKNKKS
jgi:hypothetical protein